MNILVPITLFGWVFMGIYFFSKYTPSLAVLWIFIGGWLFLPSAGYNFSGLPEYSKSTAVALAVLVGGIFTQEKRSVYGGRNIFDLLMISWCLAPFFSALSNNLGLYHGSTGVFNHVLTWGIPFYAGRKYFADPPSIKTLCMGLLIGGLVYAPLCLYEVRMSPQLSGDVYGFFAHSWRQHIRYGGYRPIVFMQHGLMVSLWMSVSAVCCFWLWRSRAIFSIKGMNISLLFVLLAVTTFLCKSINGVFFLIAGCGYWFVFKRFKSNVFFYLLIGAIPLYIVTTSQGLVTEQNLSFFLEPFVRPERLDSLFYRVANENLFCKEVLHRPIFGWGGFGRGWPKNIDTGQSLIGAIDSLWIVVFNLNGYFGLFTLFSAMLLPAVSFFRYIGRRNVAGNDLEDVYPAVLCLIVILFMIDNLVNAMINPVYILIAGAMVSHLKWRQVDDYNKSGSIQTETVSQ